MSYIHQYLEMMQKDKKGILDLQQELSRQIKRINDGWDCYSFIYASAMNKDAPGLGMNSDDFHVIDDMMRDVRHKRVLIYLQTPGGCGQTAERIAKFLHDKFDEVHFLVAGDAMRAGTILALSGHEILMTQSGSLGPIDAQMSIGRSWCSAHDYITWMDKLRNDVASTGGVHPVDGTILAQITPGEIQGVHTALNFAIDRVEEWLAKYKFRDWNFTEGRNMSVTDQMRKDRAREIAQELTNQQRWRSHGTRLSIKDLEGLNLRIIRADEKPAIADAVARVKALLWIIFSNTNTYKCYVDENRRINRNAATNSPQLDPRNAECLNVDIECQKCGQKYILFARLEDNPATRKELEQNLHSVFPSDNHLNCACGSVIDLTGHRAHIEEMTGKKILDDQPKEGS